MLISESHVAAVADPAAGSYAVEILTAEIAAAGWAEFQAIERAGGVLAALAEGSVQRRWAATAADRGARIATRRTAITGVSEFPNLRETLPVRRSTDLDDVAGVSWAGPFESMRDAPAGVPGLPRHPGQCGRPCRTGRFRGEPVRRRRGGDGDGGSQPRVSMTSSPPFRETGGPVACLAGSDRAYADRGVEVVEALRAAGAQWVVLAGRPKGALGEVVDDHVAAGDDVLEFLRRTRGHLEEAQVGR